MKSSEHIAFRLKLSLLLILIFAGFQSMAQNDVSIFGVVRDHDDNKKISGVTIEVKQDGNKYSSLSSNASGKYEFVISFDHDYEIIYTYPDYVTKFLTIDTRNVPSEEKEGGYEMNIDMTLFRRIEGLDVSILDNPIGKAQFDQGEGKMGWDMDYTRQMQAQINAMMREHDRKAQEEADRLVKMQQEFKELVQKGDDAMRNKKYSDAVDFYTDALVLFPKEEAVIAKKADAEAAVAEQLALVEKEKNYNQFIKSGDAYFGQEEWEKALSSFESAAEIFPKETYPKTRITEINKKLDEINKNAANETAVAKLVKEGDALVLKENYDEGIAKYTEALTLIPGHKVAKQQLDIANQKKEQWLAKQQEEANYNDLIAKADGQFNSNDFRAAITTYKSALAIKANEKYPKDQIAKAEGIIGQAAAEAEKRKGFDELVRQGDAKVNSSAYKEGIDIYKKALAIYPDDADVKTKIASAESALAGLMAAGELTKKYNEYIAKGDKSLGTKDYSGAKSNYEQALSLKANEAYPKDKIAEIDGILAGLSAAEEAAALKAKKEKFDKLVAQGDQNAISAKYDDAIANFESALDIIPGVTEVETKIENAKARKRDLMAGKELQDKYNGLIAKGDREFTTKSYENAKKTYQSAIDLIDDEYPHQKIAEIDSILEELANKSSLEEKQKEFEKLEKEGDAYVKSNEFESGINSYDAALGIFPDEQRVIDKKALAEKKLMALNADMASDEQYKSLIAKADKSFNEKEYSNSRQLYQSAFAIKAEDYPKNRIKEIDKILLQIERRAAEEEAAKLASVKKNKEWNSNTSDEERFIEEAEELKKRSDNDKYAELLAYKAAVKKTNQAYADKGDELRNDNVSVINSEQEQKEKFLREGEEMHDRKVNASNEELDEYNSWISKRNQEQLLASRDLYSELQEEQKEINRQKVYKSDRYKDFARELRADKEAHQNFLYKKSQEQDQKIKDNYYQSQEVAAEQYRSYSDKDGMRKANIEQVQYEKEDKVQFINQNAQKQDDKIKRGLDENNNIIKYREELAANDAEEVKKSYEDLNRENEMREVEAERWKNRSDIKRDQANDEARNTDYTGKKAADEYVAGELAQKYDQGVTEETYEEGNSKVVKRVVVKGNKADEYKMVVMKSGTYYFKNGFSITRVTWKNETEARNASMD